MSQKSIITNRVILFDTIMVQIIKSIFGVIYACIRFIYNGMYDLVFKLISADKFLISTLLKI